MKILIVLGGFFPGKKFGGPPVSVDNFCTLMDDFDSYIITLNHDLFESTPYKNIYAGWNDRGNCKVLYLNDRDYTKKTFEKCIIEINPDIIYLQGVFQSCVVPCLFLAKKYGIKVILAPRGELCEGAFNLKKYKKLPYIKMLLCLGLLRSIHWQSTSDEESDAIVKLIGVEKNLIHRLDNIPSIPKKEYKRRNKISGEGRFIFLSRVHPKKNLLYAIKCLHNVKGKVIFDIYGPMEDRAYWRKCREEINTLPENISVEYKGIVEHEHVHETLSQYDALLFPTLSENYGHIIAESLITGTPVIISDQTPWNDINELGYGAAIPLLNNKQFVNEIEKILLLNQETMGNASELVKKYAIKKMNIEHLRREYKFVFKL